MGVTVQLVLGLLLVCSGWIQDTLSSEYNATTTPSPLHDERHINLIEKLPKTDTTIKTVNKNTHIKTNYSESSQISENDSENQQNLKSNVVEKDSEKDNSLKKDAAIQKNRDDNSRSIDIERYVSPEFQNNVFTIPMSSDTEKYIEDPFSFKSSTGKGSDYIKFDLTTPRSAFFDNKFNEAIQKLEQEFEDQRNENDNHHHSHDDDHESHDLDHESHDPDHESHDPDHEDDIHDHGMEHEDDHDMEREHVHKTDEDEDMTVIGPSDTTELPTNFTVNIKEMKIMRNNTVDKNSNRNDTTVTVVRVRKIDYVTNFNDTQIFNYDDSKGDPATLNTTTPKTFIVTTRKNVVLTKPPINRNNSHILSNKIETETIKAIHLVTTELPKKGEVDSSEDISKESAKKHEINSVHSLFPIKDEETTIKTISEIQQSTATTKRDTTSSYITTTSKEDITTNNEIVTGTTINTETTIEMETTETTLKVPRDQISDTKTDSITTTEIDETSFKNNPTTIFATAIDDHTTEYVTEFKTTELGTSKPHNDEISTTEIQITESQTTESQPFESETAKVQAVDSQYKSETTESPTTEMHTTEGVTTESPEPIEHTASVFPVNSENVEGQSTYSIEETTTKETTETYTTEFNTKQQVSTIVPDYGERQSKSTSFPETTTRTTETIEKKLNRDQSAIITEITTTNAKYALSTDNPRSSSTSFNPSTETVYTIKPSNADVEPRILSNQTNPNQPVTTEYETVHVDISYSTSQQTTESSKQRINVIGDIAGHTTIEETEYGTETSSATENIITDPEDGKGKVAAIVISSVGAVCLVLLAGLLYVMRKRQKRFNYIQNCRPVSLDDYSVDNLSVYNSVRRKGIDRQSKRSYGNPAFDDPSVPTHPLNFPALAKFASNVDDMKAEFEDIPQISVRPSELPEGCEIKNRYANVIPLPETRVFLKPIDGFANSDYINANYVTGPKNTKNYYIACQGPMQYTVDDFWRMVWEQNSKVILMITHLFENGVEKCVDYLPPSEVLDCHRLFGDFQVTLKKRDVKEKYIISSLQLKNMVSNSWREVTHFWYLGWPERGIPAEANSLIAFLIEARSYMKSSTLDKNASSNGNISTSHSSNDINPVVVHCSPGTGRTGVVIACDIAIREFEQTRLVDIPKIVYRIRRDRASAVQTKEQYMFIYKVVSLYATKLTGGALDSF